jgi:hypothetical protein
MLFILIWFLFAIGCVISASNKNRNVVGWFLLGILLGPFGLLYILLVNPKKNLLMSKRLNSHGKLL